MWRLTRRGEVQEGYPVKFRQLFWKLPKHVTKIDAAYQRETDGSIVLFTGQNTYHKTYKFYLLTVFKHYVKPSFSPCLTHLQNITSLI
jgi:hypothetical protein